MSLPLPQKKRTPLVKRLQTLAALGYERAHTPSILSIAIREFSSEMRL